MTYDIIQKLSDDRILSILSKAISGVTRIFRPMGKLLLYREKTMGKMGKIFIDRPKLFLAQQSTNNVTKT
jgi:hypothetical protein